MKIRSTSLWVNLLKITIFGLGLPILGSVLSVLFFEGWRFSHEPFHAVIEGFGGFIALVIIFLLYINERSSDTKNPKLIWIITALLSMGMLDIVHAAVVVGKSFVWFHSTATFLGGFFFMFVWLPERIDKKLRHLPRYALALTISFAVVFLTFPQMIPAMVHEENFTLLAKGLNMFGGLGFIIACAYFIKNFIRNNKVDDGLLAAHCLLFGAAGLLFEISALWDAAWWWWHMLRLLAYIILIYFFYKTFEKISNNIISSRNKAQQMQQELEARTEELRIKNIELSEKTRLADRANFAKSRFLATMSHEIRTPLNGIVGMAELLLGTDLEKRQKKYTIIINSSADVLLSIIGDILDFSKIEAGEMSINSVPMNLYRHIKEMMSIMNTAAEEHNVEFIFKYDPQIPASLILDPVRIKQIVLNLTGNAVKFTENGYVIVDVQQTHNDGQGTIGLRIEITDNGIGIPLEKQEEIFENFTQADISTTREYGGTGLGLAICRRLVALMNGQIGVESEVGKGSTFWFELSAQEAGNTEETRPPIFQSGAAVALIKNQKILIVDNFAPNRDVLEGYLKSWDVNCKSVNSAQKALEELERAHENGVPYTLALVDYMMPEMDGEMLAKEIQNRETLKDIPLIMVTAAYKIKDANRARHMGFKTCILKPIYASELMDALLEVITHGKESHKGRKGKEETTLSRITLPDGRKPKILVVEDSCINQMFAEELLGELGCEVEIADNGAIALKQYQKNLYDLVLMDCMMPEMDGYEATKMIRKYDRENNNSPTPIIAMTANAMAGDREKCLNVGMDDYIAKPARREDIRLVLEKYLDQATHTI